MNRSRRVCIFIYCLNSYIVSTYFSSVFRFRFHLTALIQLSGRLAPIATCPSVHVSGCKRAVDDVTIIAHGWEIPEDPWRAFPRSMGNVPLKIILQNGWLIVGNPMEILYFIDDDLGVRPMTGKPPHGDHDWRVYLSWHKQSKRGVCHVEHDEACSFP